MAALYRRYRPETFQEVTGQAHVTDPLRHALTADRIHHAYLFSGPRGCGKTTSARILARCLNCQEGPTDSPCGVCASCVELSRDGGGSLDVVEIDAASHNGVDDARELRERAVFAPARDRFKIFILDEAHMVTQQGFNALLKIVEEPPEHVKFIFATTEPEKVLTTIRSRTHHYPFRLVPPAELIAYLESVVASEKVRVEPGVLALVVRSGGGSVRDSLSLLDQLIAGSSDNAISLESAQSLLGYTPRVILDDVLLHLSQADGHRLFTSINQAMALGQDPRRFVEDLLEHLRDVMVIQATSKDSSDLFPGVSDEDLARWNEQSGWFDQATLSQMASEVNRALGDMAGVISSKLQLELLAAQLLSMTSSTHQKNVESPGKSRDGGDESREVKPEGPDELLPNQTESPATTSTSQTPGSDQKANGLPVTPWTLEGMVSVWPQILDELSRHKRSLWIALAETKPLAVHDDVLTIGFVRKIDSEILKKPQGPGSPLPNADLLRDAIHHFTGHRVRFTVAELNPEETFSAPASSEEVRWPVVSRQGSELEDNNESTPAHDEVEPHPEADSSADAGEPVAETAPIATRGEPVIRQLLGGELIGEEFLESMDNRGEGDV